MRTSYSVKTQELFLFFICLFSLLCKELVLTELGAEFIEIKEFCSQQIWELFLISWYRRRSGVAAGPPWQFD